MEEVMSGTTLKQLETVRVLEGDQIIKASAGTGKTYTLINTVVDKAETFLKDNSRLPRMIISTFTKKATEELRERIAKEILEKQKTALYDMIQGPQNLHISTIHGVLSQFLRKFGNFFDIESGFNVTDEDQSREQTENLLHLFSKRAEVKSKYKELFLNFNFTEIYEAMDKLYEVKAVFPDSKFADLETQKQSLQQTVFEHAEKAFDVLKAFGTCDHEKFTQFQDIWTAVLGQIVQQKNTEYENLLIQLDALPTIRHSKQLPITKEELSDFRELSKEVKKQLELAAAWQKMLPTYEAYNQLFEQFANEFIPTLIQHKKQLGTLDSRDLEVFSLLLLREKPFLGGAFAADWDYWMIDEFQDTSPLQVELIDLLRGNSEIFYVGDPQQSIYLFRGARVEVFEEVRSKIIAKNGPQKELTVNRRSSKEALGGINQLLDGMGSQFTAMQAFEGSEQGDETVGLNFLFEDSEGQNLSLVAHIQSLIEKGANYSDICVLGRRRQDLNHTAQLLKSYNIPVTVHLSEGFYGKREVLDLLALAKFLVNPHDNKNLFVLLRSPFFRIYDKELINFRKPKSSLWTMLNNELPDNTSVQALQALQLKAKEVGVYQSLSAFIKDSGFFMSSQFLDPSLRREANFWKLLGQMREAEKKPGFNYLKYLRQAEQALSDRTSDDQEAVPASEANQVNLMTIHKSKGLSFPHVIIPNMDSEISYEKSKAHNSVIAFDEGTQLWSAIAVDPSANTKRHSPAVMRSLNQFTEREYAEFVRLLYVAITRAENSVCLHARQGKKAFGAKSWASLFSNWHEAGLKKEKTHQILVSHGPWDVKNLGAQNQVGSVDRPKAFESSQQTETLKRFSVSSLLEDGESASSGYLPKDSEGRKNFIYAPAFGTQIHQVFEDLKFFDKQDVLSHIKNQPEMINAVEWTLSLQEPPMQEIIKNGHVEWGFQLKTELGIMEGQIDLWAELNNQVWVFDYKSGSSKYSEKAFQQLKYYAYALNKNYGFKNINLAVLYPIEQKCHTQAFDLDEVTLQLSRSRT